ncbi:MAG: tRNA pseudouridine(55) synthase TruB [Defluviitaleaceae bacterium]|nr:tRNA pseudouridine(55) synthase TruB [Defluviitaleaceae bacterium]
MTGFFNVYKEAGYTSHDVVAIIRKLTKTKVGHTGTLDPQAEGVLPICIGRATKLADMITGQKKSYTAEVVLGLTTDTGDMTGQVLTQSPVDCNKANIFEAVERFRGPQMQVPPMYSAIKIGGKKLYDLARKGQTVERKPRAVSIDSIEITKFEPGKNSFTIDVTCSKGTYIRSLCMDIGEVLGTGAAMGTLVRTSSGAFSVDRAVKLDQIKESAADGSIMDLLIPVETVLPFPRAYVKAEGLAMAKNGNPLPFDLVDMPNGEKFWLHGPEGLIGLYSHDTEKGRLRLEVML